MAYLHHCRVRSPIKKVARLRPEDRAKATFHPHSMFRVAEFSGEMAPADPDYVPRGGLDHRSKIRFSSRALKNEVLSCRQQPVRSIYENYDDEDEKDSRGRRRVQVKDEDEFTTYHCGPYELESESDFPSNFGITERGSKAVRIRNGRDGTDRHGVNQRLADIESTDSNIRTDRSWLGLETDEFDRRGRVESMESSEARERSYPRSGSTGNNHRGYEGKVKRTMLFPRGRGSFYNCNNYLDSDRPAWNGSSYNCSPRVSSDFSGPREPSYAHDAFTRSYSGRGTGYRDPSYSSVPYTYSERARDSMVSKSSQNRPELPRFGLSSARKHEQRTSSELFYTDRYPSESKRSSRRSEVNDLSPRRRSASTKNEVRIKHESHGRYPPSTSKRCSQFERIENDEEYIRSKGKRSRYY